MPEQEIRTPGLLARFVLCRTALTFVMVRKSTVQEHPSVACRLCLGNELPHVWCEVK